MNDEAEDLSKDRPDVEKIVEAMGDIEGTLSEIAEHLAMLVNFLENLTFECGQFPRSEARALRISNIGE